MNRGFTIVELTIVIAVIAVLTGISLAITSTYQNKSNDASAKAIAATVKSAAEKYYVNNNEYPLPSNLTGTQSDQTGPPSNYNVASLVLNVPTESLKTQNFNFVTCHTSCLGSNLNKRYVYYFTKYGPATTNDYNYTLPNSSGVNCTYTIPSPESGGLSYLIAFWSIQNGRWEVVRSNRGAQATTSSTANCPFTAL